MNYQLKSVFNLNYSKEIPNIETKVKVLAQILELLYKENIALKRSLSENKKTTTSRSVQGRASSSELKNRVQHLIGEVEKCIELLSD